MLKNTRPFWVFAALAAPIFAGTQDDEHTVPIGFYMGIVVEGIARNGMMVWEPWRRLELWWVQDDRCSRGDHIDEKEEETHDEEEEDGEEAAADAEEEQWGEDVE